MKDVNQKEEWDRIKRNIIGTDSVRDGEWRPVSDIMFEDAFVASFYDSALMNNAMQQKIDLASNELEAMTNEDEDGEFSSILGDDADDGLVDEDDD